MQTCILKFSESSSQISLLCHHIIPSLNAKTYKFKKKTYVHVCTHAKYRYRKKLATRVAKSANKMKKKNAVVKKSLLRKLNKYRATEQCFKLLLYFNAFYTFAMEREKKRRVFCNFTLLLPSRIFCKLLKILLDFDFHRCEKVYCTMSGYTSANKGERMRSNMWRKKVVEYLQSDETSGSFLTSLAL